MTTDSKRNADLRKLERMKAAAELQAKKAKPETLLSEAAALAVRTVTGAISAIERDADEKPPKGKTVPVRKAKKPRPDFPLYPHLASGYWSKKVRGKTRYFGKIADDPKGRAALLLWLDQKDSLIAGRDPHTSAVQAGALTVADVSNAFLEFKQSLLDSGELAQRTFDYYHHVCSVVNSVFGKTRAVEDLKPQDFEKLRGYMSKRWGAVRLGNMITVVRSLFKYAVDSDLIDRPVKVGPGFAKPSAKTFRKLRAERGPRMFEAEQLRKVLDEAGPNVKAMTLLAINCGLGNTDLALLPTNAIDLKGSWLDYARTKTGIMRRIPLWPETVAAVREVLAGRPKPNNSSDGALLFISPKGMSYVGDRSGYRIGHEFGYVVRRAGIEGRSFYDLRRTFQTIADGSHDAVAVSAIMGHAAASGDMSAIYRQRIDDARLVAVVNHVHGWLFLPVDEAKTEQTTNAIEKPKPKRKRAKTEQQPVSVESPIQLRVVG